MEIFRDEQVTLGLYLNDLSPVKKESIILCLISRCLRKTDKFVWTYK